MFLRTIGRFGVPQSRVYIVVLRRMNADELIAVPHIVAPFDTNQLR